MERPTFRSFWHGGELDPLAWACLSSFGEGNCNVALYCYDRVRAPKGVSLADANDIVTRDSLFNWKGFWQPFSDLFRYELIYKYGGWWIDTDVVLLGESVPSAPLLIAEEEPGHFNNGQMKFPPGHPAVQELIERARKIGRNQAKWGETGPALVTQAVSRHGLQKYAAPTKLFYPLHWLEVYKFWLPEYREEVEQRTKGGFCLHLWSSTFNRMGIPLQLAPPAESYLANLYERYPFHAALRNPTDAEYAQILQSIQSYTSQRWVQEAASRIGVKISPEA